MNRQRLFQRSRQQLALAYSGVMWLILTGLGLGVYQAIVHAHAVTIERELQSVAGTLHDSLQWKLVQPGQLEPIVTALLPNLCPVSQVCSPALPPRDRYTLSAINQGNYYVRLWDASGQLVASAGRMPRSLPATFNPQAQQILRDRDQRIYHQVSLALHTRDRQDWGTLQVGRSRQDAEMYLRTVRWCLGLGILAALGLAAVASYWLAGLALKPIDRAYQAIQQFTADAAHELRTPIAAVLATVEAAQLAPTPTIQDQAEVLMIVHRQNQRLSTLVADLLFLARLEQEPDPGLPQSCCLNELILDLTEEMAALAIAADLDFTTEVTTMTALWVQGNSDQLYRLVSNLLINAIQYTPAGGKICLHLHHHRQSAYLQVRDTGPGIAMEEQPKVFDRFYRLDCDRSRKTGGAGLGLAIAQAIAQSHGGELHLESQPGQGSTFTVILPLA
ncbi:MAG: two-component sensor histidine kinase [Spirulina sp. SIO3F2]|nr:two-component sensor histidine kinase [Spirulina sp. SIO3F2]